MLGAEGATVYCSGRSSAGALPTTGPYAGRKETIEETAELVEAHGGTGIAIRTDHSDERQVAALLNRVREEQGRLDVLVNVFWGGPQVMHWGKFWKHPLDDARALMCAAWPHVVTSTHAAGLMVEQSSGLIVQLTEGHTLRYRMNLCYDLGRIAEIRLAHAMAEELAPLGVTALALTPGYLRSEAMLDYFGVTEANWREGTKKDPNFIASETPAFVGRAVGALAADPNVIAKAGGLFSSWGLAREYGFTDVDGSQPDWQAHFDEHKLESMFPTRTSFEWSVTQRGPGKMARRRAVKGATKKRRAR
jgi:NAD(P)-dependent dehydrogenase (short-subunit alcohol dehydrogenase family)